MSNNEFKLTHSLTHTTITFIPHDDGTIGVVTTVDNGNFDSRTVSKQEARQTYKAWRKLGAYKDSEFKKIGKNLYRVEQGNMLSISYVDDWYADHGWSQSMIPEGYEVRRLEYLEKDDTYSHHESPVKMWLAPVTVSQ